MSDTNETKEQNLKAYNKIGNKNKNCNEGFICPEDKICNPDTGKCVSKKGAVGKKILEGTKNDKKRKQVDKKQKK